MSYRLWQSASQEVSIEKLDLGGSMHKKGNLYVHAGNRGAKTCSKQQGGKR